MLSVGPVTGNVNFDRLVKGVYVNFLHCKFIILHFVITKGFVGRYLETAFIPYF